MRRPSVPGSVPAAVLVVAVLAAVASGVIMFAGAVTIGTTWDENSLTVMLQTFFDQGWHMTPDAILDGLPDPKYYFGVYVYGPVGEILPHLVNVLAGRESWGTMSETAAAYSGRHIGVALTALVGIAVTGLGTALITQGRRWGLLAACLLAVTPLWAGHGMMNIKDIPTAVGYTTATVGLIAFVRPDYFSDRRIRILALAALVLGTVLGVGTRTATVFPLVGAVVIVPFFLWVMARLEGKSEARAVRASRRFTESVVALFAAYLLLLAIYPKAYSNVIDVAIRSALDSALYPVNEAQLTAGTWMVQPVSWTYLPLWFAAQLPLIVLVLGLMGVGGWLLLTFRYLFVGRRSSAVPRAVTALVPVLLQAFTLPLGAIAGHSTLYNGTRQMLFVVPAVVILATVGLRWLIRLLKPAPTERRAWAITSVWVLVCAGVVAPVIAQIQLFPYGYTYFNAVAALRPIDGNWPTDYWRASGRELLERVPATGPESCGTEQLAKGRLFPCSTESMFRPHLDVRGSQALQAKLGPDGYWFIRENGGNLEIPPGCRPFDTVSRHLFWRNVTIGQILICQASVDTGVRNMADPSKPAP